MNKWILFVMTWIVPIALLQAQATPAPRPPAVSFPEGDAAWKIDITYHDKAQPDPRSLAAQPRRTKIEIERTGEISDYRTSWSNLRTTEDWLTRAFVFWQNQTTGQVLVIPKGGTILTYECYDKTYFDWVGSGEVLSERESFRGRICIHVRKAFAAGLNPDGSPATGYLQAWLDAQTLIPVASDDTQALYVFTFLPPPATPLVLPQQDQDLQARYVSARTAPKRLGY